MFVLLNRSAHSAGPFLVPSAWYISSWLLVCLLLGALGGPLGTPEGPWGVPGGPLGSLGVLGGPRGFLGTPWGSLGVPAGSLGVAGRPQGSPEISRDPK